MRNYYAKFKGECYAFNDKNGRDTAVNEYGFEKLARSKAMLQFGYTDSCSRRKIKGVTVSSSSPLELRNYLAEVVK